MSYAINIICEILINLLSKDFTPYIDFLNLNGGPSKQTKLNSSPPVTNLNGLLNYI